MIKLCIDNTALLREFHLYEPYLYKDVSEKNLFLLNDFSRDNSDINSFDTTIRSAENVLQEYNDIDYEVIVLTEMLNNDLPILQKIYEIDREILSKFTNSRIKKTKNTTILLLDHTGNSYFDLKNTIYLTDDESDLYLTKAEVKEVENEFKQTRDRKALLDNLIKLKVTKTKVRENEWYFYIFDKMIKEFINSNLYDFDRIDKTFDLCEIYSEIMSYYVKSQLLDNKLILRYDMYSGKHLYSNDVKNFIDMNKIIGLLSFDMTDYFEQTRIKLYKGIYDVNIGLDDEILKNMIAQYSENLKIQHDMLIHGKQDKLEVDKRVMPQVSLRPIFLEPIKPSKERLTFFRSSRNVQYLDRIEKNLTLMMNKHIQKAKSSNVQSICDLRTLRLVDDKTTGKEKLSLIEIKDRIEDKQNLYARKKTETFKNRIDYFQILNDFLKKQKLKKDRLVEIVNTKTKMSEFLITITSINFILFLAIVFAKIAKLQSTTTQNIIITIVCGLFAIISGSLACIIRENSVIKKQIKEYINFVNKYNEKLQITSDEELKKLTTTYELIVINNDIEYYKNKYIELLNTTSKYEFHISQIEKHMEVARRLCARVGLNFDDIKIANDSEYDDKNIDVDISKGVYENGCYNVTHFLFERDDYSVMMNGAEVLDKQKIYTYIKGINFYEDEVYKF